MRRLAGILLLGLFVVGCSTQTPQASEEVTKDFKGGPMPPEFRQKFEKMQKDSAPKGDQSK